MPEISWILSGGGGTRFGFSIAESMPQKFAPHSFPTRLEFTVTFQDDSVAASVPNPYDRTAIHHVCV
jgi:hypothetical protein